jgi:hypothetical protein
VITLTPTGTDILAYVDASYAVHPDLKSHTGIIITLGGKGGTVYVRSSKQKITADSSTYAEIIALHDGVRHILWLQQLLSDIGFASSKPAVIYQDNQSPIHQ